MNFLRGFAKFTFEACLWLGAVVVFGVLLRIVWTFFLFGWRLW